MGCSLGSVVRFHALLTQTSLVSIGLFIRARPWCRDFAEAWWRISRFDSLALHDQAAYHGICAGGVGKVFFARQFFLGWRTEVRLLGRNETVRQLG